MRPKCRQYGRASACRRRRRRAETRKVPGEEGGAAAGPSLGVEPILPCRQPPQASAHASCPAVDASHRYPPHPPTPPSLAPTDPPSPGRLCAGPSPPLAQLTSATAPSAPAASSLFARARVLHCSQTCVHTVQHPKAAGRGVKWRGGAGWGGGWGGAARAERGDAGTGGDVGRWWMGGQRGKGRWGGSLERSARIGRLHSLHARRAPEARAHTRAHTGHHHRHHRGADRRQGAGRARHYGCCDPAARCNSPRRWGRRGWGGVGGGAWLQCAYYALSLAIAPLPSTRPRPRDRASTLAAREIYISAALFPAASLPSSPSPSSSLALHL